ncbi:TorA maturation chaperone TorD [Azospirillum picis]|uniref:TorA maturation chaperone TorD n=2 Tax=Azospirillum picis TaxID=488438 RepID=A0ABU0MIF4_9PROT|nr:TorA maturation chaperone TorD [Azospirillum picis]MDQ0533240.1 TorA maturation chaperone TorD [Azospirillum picis]
MDSMVLEAAAPLVRQRTPDDDETGRPVADAAPGGASAGDGSPAEQDADFGDAAAALRLLALLHAQAPTPAFLEDLRNNPIGGRGLALDRDDAIQASALIDEVVSDLPPRITRRSISPLASDYTTIHVTGEYCACPTEAPWLDVQARPAAAASLRGWRAGFETALRRPPADRLPEDHVAAELLLLAHLLDLGRKADGVQFLDRHVLRWIPGFCSRIATRCREPFYAGAAILTTAHLDHLRDRLGSACGMPRPNGDGADVRRRRRTEGQFPLTCDCEG